MAEDIEKVLRRIQGFAAKLETNHSQVDEMMLLFIQDGLGAMRYGQYGGSFPDPTARTVIAPEGVTAIFARDNRAETDRSDYALCIKTALDAIERADTIRQRYMSANNEIRNRLDPNVYCRVHWFCRFDEHLPNHLKSCPKRFRGDMCKDCYERYQVTGKEPDATDVTYHHTHNGNWPPARFDPKERRAV